RVLAEGLLQESGGEDRSLLTRAFRKLTSRRPSERELTILTQMLGEQRDHFSQHPDEAKQFAEAGESPAAEDRDPVEVAAFGVVISSLLSFDDTVMKP
ncbi:MAG: hypothetical protein AAF514_24730, partial [Verrucomicrobiota bacterium]